MNGFQPSSKHQIVLLELFCGTGSVGQVAKEMGWEVISVDINPRWKPDICIDICELDADAINEKYGKIDVIWASPDCSQYSQILNGYPKYKRKLQESNRVVEHTLALIAKLNPTYWFMENPATGLLKEQDFMKNIQWKDCCYCRYNKGRAFRKHTRIWGSGVSKWANPRMCARYATKEPRPGEAIVAKRRRLQKHGLTCEFYRIHGRHDMTVGSNVSRYPYTTNLSKLDRLRIPRKLIWDLLSGLQL